LPLTQKFVRSLEYMAACLDPHLGTLEAKVLRKINDNFMRNAHFDRLRPQCISLFDIV